MEDDSGNGMGQVELQWFIIDSERAHDYVTHYPSHCDRDSLRERGVSSSLSSSIYTGGTYACIMDDIELWSYKEISSNDTYSHDASW